MIIKIGTRGSKLALFQANYIAELLQKNELFTEIIIIETKGDKILNKALSKIGSKGVFTEELEEALRNKTIDIAIHSAKDMQSTLMDDLEIIAYSEREKANDVMVSFNKDARLANFDDSFILGTSSTRRTAMVKRHFPHVRVADVRGNLQNRMKKMEKGDYDGLLLAYAGIRRLNLQQYIVEEFSTDVFTPPVGQGCIAVEASINLNAEKRDVIRKSVNHPESELCLLTERSFLKTLQGGCSVPVFGFATLKNDEIHLQGGIISLDGKREIRENISGSISQAEALGKHLAEILLSNGADEILKEIKRGE